MQNGRIYRKGSAWILSYAVKAQEPDGTITWARRSKRLAPYGDEYRTEASVRHLASEILAPINARGDDFCEELDLDLTFPQGQGEGEGLRVPPFRCGSTELTSRIRSL
jgi:hypothetical protein